MNDLRNKKKTLALVKKKWPNTAIWEIPFNILLILELTNGLKVKFRRIDGNWEDETNSQLTENNLLFLEESPYWDVIRSKDIK